MAHTLSGFTYHFEPSGGRGRTLLLLHGTGGSELDLVLLGRGLAPGAALLAPRGPVIERGMHRFFRRLSEGVFDEEDVIVRAGALAEFVRQAAEVHELAPDLVTAVGFSNGANIAAALLLLHPGVLAGAVLLRAMVPVQDPPIHALEGTPVLLLQGEHDPIVSRTEGERLTTMLEERGAAVRVAWQRAGHALVDADLVAAAEFLAE